MPACTPVLFSMPQKDVQPIKAKQPQPQNHVRPPTRVRAKDAGQDHFHIVVNQKIANAPDPLCVLLCWEFIQRRPKARVCRQKRCIHTAHGFDFRSLPSNSIGSLVPCSAPSFLMIVQRCSHATDMTLFKMSSGFGPQLVHMVLVDVVCKVRDL